MSEVKYLFHALLKCNGIDFHGSDLAAPQHREGTVPASRHARTLQVPSEELLVPPPCAVLPVSCSPSANSPPASHKNQGNL